MKENKRDVATTCSGVCSGIKCEGIIDDEKARDARTNATRGEFINRRKVNGSGASTTKH